MGSSSSINFNKEKNEIFALEKINKKEFLLKTSSKNFCLDDKKEILLNKLNTLLKLSPYKNSVKYIGYYEDEENINIVTERCDMNLLEYLNKKGKLDIDEIKAIFVQLNNIFHAMLNNNIIHKIIKLDNIFMKLNDEKKTNNNINDYTFKLSGYENEELIKEYIKYDKFDKIISLAPEMLQGENYDNKIDLYSIGIVMYQLYFNCHPFGNSLSEINYKISNNENNIKLSGNNIFDDLLQSLLQFNPENRISWEKYFNHDFFKDNHSSQLNYTNDDLLNFQYIIKNEDDEDLSTNKNHNSSNKDRSSIIEKFNLKFKNKISKIKYEDTKLNFSEKSLGNEGLELLSKIKFNTIEEINLNYNKINDIKMISKMNLSQMIKLDLSHNKIKDIKEFEKCNLCLLVELKMSFNEINNIDIFEKCNLPNMKLLYLTNNKISNIEVLDKCNFILLNELYLSNNQIEDINIFSNCNFPHLHKLGLSENLINNIKVLSDCNFTELNKLYLYGNKIDNIDIFSKCNFPELNELYLYDNKIINTLIEDEI
jgi:serine/threonine protein kinase